MTHVKTEYRMISPLELTRADEHTETFFATSEAEHEGTIDSYKKYGRLKPVYIVVRTIEDKTMKDVIDGWKYVVFAQQAGIKEIFCCLLTIDDNDDLVKIMIQLQRSNHDSYMALFKMIQKLWPIHYRGQGYRSDLAEKELIKPTESPDGGRPMNIYARIGWDMNLKGNEVQHIRKVGMVNPLHFERMETTRFSLYAGYLECLKEEKGEEPEVPSVKAPEYISNSTGIPEFSAPTTTADATADSETNTPASDNVTGKTPEAQDSNDSEFIVVRGICMSCNKETEIKINKNKLL